MNCPLLQYFCTLTIYPVHTEQILEFSHCDFYDRFNTSQSATLRFDLSPISVYCHVGDLGCGNGAWTTVMKIDGTKVSFVFNLSHQFISSRNRSEHCSHQFKRYFKAIFLLARMEPNISC